MQSGNFKRISALFIAAALGVSAPIGSLAAENMNKGLLAQDITMLDDAVEIGTDEIIYNLTAGSWLNAASGIRGLLQRVKSKGMDVTVVLLNDNQSVKPQLRVADADLSNHYFMFNVFDESGKQATEEFFDDVSSSLSGIADRFIIGNEIQDQLWNYVGPMDVTTYCGKYAEVFTSAYQIIKANAPQAEVYIPFDYGWTNESNNSTKYNGKTCLSLLAGMLPKEMDWGIAWHAYPDPLTSPVFWDDSVAPNSPDAIVVNFNNLNVLTDFMQTEAMLRGDGSVRNLILSEQGFTSQVNGVSDESLQAAAYACGYFIAKNNPYVKSYLLNRQVDAKSEVLQGRAFGMWNTDMNADGNEVPTTPKYLREVFRDVDREGQNQYIKDLVYEKTGMQF